MSSLTATRFDQAGLVRVALDVSDYTPTVPTTATIIRYASDGTSYTVRNAEPATLGAGLITVDDFEAPLDTTFYYTAVPNAGATISSSSLSVPADAAFGIPTSWLKDPGQPANNVPVQLTGDIQWTRPARMGLFDVIGRATPTSVQAVRGSMRGTVRFVTLNPASITDMVTIFSTGNVLLLQTPGGYRFGNVYVACGDLLELRATTILRDSTRYWQVDVTVVDRPTGISQGLSNTYTVALATYPTYAAMAGATYFNVLAGVDPNSVGANTFVNPIYGGTVL